MPELVKPVVVLSTEEAFFGDAVKGLTEHGISVLRPAGMYPRGYIYVRLYPLVGTHYNVTIEKDVLDGPRKKEGEHVKSFASAIVYITRRCYELSGRAMDIPDAVETSTPKKEESEMSTTVEPKIIVTARDGLKEEVREGLAACNLKVTDVSPDRATESPSISVYVYARDGKAYGVKVYAFADRIIRWATPTTTVFDSGAVTSFIVGQYRALKAFCNTRKVKDVEVETPKKISIAVCTRFSHAVTLLREELPNNVTIRSVEQQGEREERDWDIYLDIVHFGDTEVSAYLDREYRDELIEDEYLTLKASCPRALAAGLAKRIEEYFPETSAKEISLFDIETPSETLAENHWSVIGPKITGSLGSAIREMDGFGSKWRWVDNTTLTPPKNRVVSFTKDEGRIHVTVFLDGKIDHTLVSGDYVISKAVSWFANKYLNRV